MRKLKLYEEHYTDLKMKTDLEDMLVEFKDIGMSVKVNKLGDGFGDFYIQIIQSNIREFSDLSYPDARNKFNMLNDDGTHFLDIKSLIQINEPLMESIFSMTMDYMQSENMKMIRIVYKEPFNQSVIKDINGRFSNDYFMGIDITDYEMLVKVITGKRLEKLEIYFNYIKLI